MKRLLVVGAGGHAKVVVDAARTSGAWELVALVDDSAALWGKAVEGVAVAGATGNWSVWSDRVDAVIVALGNTRLREQFQAAAMEAGLTAAIVVHPRSTIASSARLGAGTVVMAGAIVNPDARIGQGVILNTGATIDHDCVIGDWVHVGPGVSLCGEVQVGRGTLIGIGAKVLPGVRIGAHCVVGAGAVVHRDWSDGSKIAGVPARAL